LSHLLAIVVSELRSKFRERSKSLTYHRDKLSLKQVIIHHLGITAVTASVTSVLVYIDSRENE